MMLTRELVIEKIQEHLDGRLKAKALAEWAFDQTYAYEIEELEYEQGAEDLLDEVLDELVFNDEPPFQLDQEQLLELIQLLRDPAAAAGDGDGAP